MKLAILADCHVSSPNAPDGEENHAQGLGMLERAVRRITDLRCDRTIVVGDLVNMGYDEEYADAKRVLAPLGEALDVLPGNHEVVRGTLDRFHQQFGPTAVRTTYAGVTAIRLNTTLAQWTDRLWAGTLDDPSRALLHTAAQADGPLLVFAHHPFSGTVRSAPYPMMSQYRDDAERLRLIARPAPTVVFTGHAHRADVQRLWQCTFIGCPPLCFWPHAFLTVEFDDTHLHVQTHRLVEDVADSPDPKTREGEQHLSSADYVTDCEPPMPSFSLRLR